MRIIAYNQLLQSYSSLTLKGMAQAFGCSEGFLDKELSRFIATGRLNCKIDKVRGIIETTRPDSKNFLYQEVIKKRRFITQSGTKTQSCYQHLTE